MSDSAPPPPQRIACIGGGVIGAAWAARFALGGADVAVYDSDPDAEKKIAVTMREAKRARLKISMIPLKKIGEVRIAKDLRDAVSGAEFIQESLPEREDLKKKILAEADAIADSNAIIASSTSGLLPTRLQSEMSHPERFCIAHPFNPVYLLPLVELCGGKKTHAATLEKAAAIYRAFGMHPLVVRAEIDGFIADRLMESLWRESLWLIHDGIATAAEIDDAIRYGCGLRWAFMGPFMTYRLAGGDDGMRHFLSQFGPTLKLPWSKLTNTPPLTDEFADKIAEQSDSQAGDSSSDELRRLRDDCLIAIMHGLRRHNYGAGALLKAAEESLYEDSHSREIKESDDLTAPLFLHQTVVADEWTDYNGHMNESRYLQVFSNSCDDLLRYIGVDSAQHKKGFSYFTAETHIVHRRETRAGEQLFVSMQILGADEKRLHIFQQIHIGAEDGEIAATAEQMLLAVDTKQGRVTAAPEVIAKNAAILAKSHAALPIPSAMGQGIAMRKKS